MVPTNTVNKPSITIDYFPPEVYHEYEQDQRYLDPSLTRESSSISSQVQILVTSPNKTNEHEVLGNDIRGTYASFEAPPKLDNEASSFAALQRGIFTHELFPLINIDPLLDYPEFHEFHETVVELTAIIHEARGKMSQYQKG